jgi:ATP-dependent HslUV protease subunit HslV
MDANTNPTGGPAIRGTTILAVRKGGVVCVGGDGQVTMGNSMIVKATARKVRRLHDGRVLAGFAGATADAMTLFEKLESKLQEYGGNLTRAAVELAKDWRTDRYLRRLEAMLIAADGQSLLLISGTGDVIEPDEGLVAIGSGGGFALAAAKALMDREDLSAEAITRRALAIAASLCVFTNENLIVETLVQNGA